MTADVRSFFVAGTPKGKGRPRFTAVGGYARTYTDKQTRQYEQKIALAYSAANIGKKPYDKDVALDVTIMAMFCKPKSWTKKKKRQAKWHTKKPDADNIAKVLDALNGVAWVDDSQIASISVRKVYVDEQSDEGMSVIVMQAGYRTGGVQNDR